MARGYGATSMAEVAKTVQAVWLGTVYARFASKSDLFKAIIDEQIQQNWRLAFDITAQSPKPFRQCCGSTWRSRR